MDRLELYRKFAERFHGGKRLRPATDDQISEAETALGVLWPESYRQFSLTCGAIYTPSLVELIVELNLEFADVQDFLTPKQTVTETRRSLAEPPGTGIVFANDCSGNLFTFRELSSNCRVEDSPVWFFDHENNSFNKEADSFDEWISRFVGLGA